MLKGATLKIFPTILGMMFWLINVSLAESPESKNTPEIINIGAILTLSGTGADGGEWTGKIAYVIGHVCP